MVARPFDPPLATELVEQIPAVVYVLTFDEPPQVLYISPRCDEILGFLPDECEADPTVGFRHIHPDDAEPTYSRWRELMEAGSSFSGEYRYLHPDGRNRWLIDRARPVAGDDGRTKLVYGFIEDITARRHAEQELTGSETRYRALIENIPAVIYEMGPEDERRTIYVSPHVEKILGYTRAEWLDQPDIWTELLHPDDREIELAAHDLHNETGEPWLRRYRLIADDGRIVWVRDHAVLVRSGEDDPPRWHGVLLDVTAQKEAEDQLQQANDELEFRVATRTTALADANELMGIEIAERRRAQDDASLAEERLRVLVEHLPAVVYTWNLGDDPETEYTSPQIQDMLGYTPEEWSDTDLWVERLHPHDRERVLASVKQCREAGKPLNIEYRYLDKEGRVVWVLDRGTLTRRDGAGRPGVFQGVMLPISARKAAEAKASQAETRFRVLAEQGPLITYIWHLRSKGPQSPHTFLSPQIEQLLGYPLERWSADVHFWRSILHPDDHDRLVALEGELESTGRPWGIDYRVIAADGRVVWLHDEGHVLERDEKGEPSVFQGIMLDITDRKEAEEGLRSSEATYRSLVEGMPAIPWTERLDPATGRSRFTYIGPQSTDILGYTPEELMAELGHFERMLHPEDRERVIEEARRSDTTREPWDAEYRVIARDGRVIRMRSRAVLTTDQEGLQIWQGIAIVQPGPQDQEAVESRAEDRSEPDGRADPSTGIASR